MLLSIALCLLADTQGYYRQPALHGDTIVFVAEGDLWSASVDGGIARRLTAHDGLERMPAISPDGSTLAFMAQYEGPTEVYTMPLTGGVPQRRTWGAGRGPLVGFSPDGSELLYSSARYSGLPNKQLVAINLATGNERVLPLAQASDGVLADDGTLYFTRHSYQGSATKRYSGGTARSLWSYAPGDGEAVHLTHDDDGESWAPMLVDGRLWFVADGGAVRNLWSMRTDGTDRRQETLFGDWGVQDPSSQGDRIVFQQGADIWMHDADAGATKRIDIRLSSDLDGLRERWVTEPLEWVTALHVSPDGEQVVATARGELFVLPVAPRGTERRIRIDTDQSVRYRDGRYLPDGRILALSDASGELEFVTLDADGRSGPTPLTQNSTVHRMGAAVSPDGRWIAWHDKNFEVWVHDIDSGASTRVFTAPMGDIEGLVFSPSSTRLAWASTESNQYQVIHIHDLETGETVAATSNRVHSKSPTFDATGEWLFFISDRNFTNEVRSPWGPYAPDPKLVKRRVVCAVPLTGQARSPLRMDDEVDREIEAAKDEAKKDTAEEDTDATDEAETDESAPDEDGHANDESDDDESDEDAEDDDALAPRLEWDLADLPGRTLQLPLAAGDWSRVVCGDKHLYLLTDGTLKSLSLEPAHEVETEDVASKVRSFELTPDREKILIRQRNKAAVGPANGGTVDMDKDTVDTAGWRFTLDPRREFAQMFREAWRLHRDYFYDPDMHGLDWDRVYDKYKPLADRVIDRSDLNDVLAQMMGELSVLHTFVNGGDRKGPPQSVSQGMLGAQLEPVQGGLRIASIPLTDPDFPKERAPLAQAGMDVEVGDVITHVNGQPVTALSDVGLLLRGEAGRPARLTLAPRQDDAQPRNLMVRVISTGAGSELRYDAWEYDRRVRVEDASDGQLGYVHVRAMGGSNYANDFARNFYPIHNRAGIIIDMRHNRGGNIDSWLLGKLMKRPWMYWAGRAGEPSWNMQYAPHGHLVVLCDGRTASDGEAFCDGFRRLGLGEAIGTRTWGGEVWLSFGNRLVDRGIASAAEFGVYGPEGEWLIEGRGFEPDHVVDNLPHETFNGRDRQLEAAVSHLQKLIEQDPRTVPPPPARPRLAPKDLRVQ